MFVQSCPKRYFLLYATRYKYTVNFNENIQKVEYLICLLIKIAKNIYKLSQMFRINQVIKRDK